MSTLFQLGAVTIDCPGPLNATETTEGFGGDYAVKAVVGAQQPREFVGPADKPFTLTGKLFPFFYNRLGLGSGLNEIDMLKAMADSGEAQILVRGDGVMLGFYFIEKGSLKSRTLSRQGIGHEIVWDINLMQSPDAPSADSMQSTLDDLDQLFA